MSSKRGLLRVGRDLAGRSSFTPGSKTILHLSTTTTRRSIPPCRGRFEVRLDEQIERIELFPGSGHILFASYRRVLLKRFPYMAVYLVGDERIDLAMSASICSPS